MKYKMKSVKRKYSRRSCKHYVHHKNKKTHHKRLRSQRGGTLEEKYAEYDRVISEYEQCSDLAIQLSIQGFFNNCENFKRLLKLRNEDASMVPLKKVVCGNKTVTLTDPEIRKVEFAFIFQVSKQFPYIKNLETAWPAFVLHLKKVVETGYQKMTDAEIDARLAALKRND
jgi:hypothetical protein